MSGADQNGLSQTATRTVAVPVTTYSGVAFNGNDSVTDLASLKRYNTSLISQVTAGTLTPADYDRLIQSAVTTTTQQVVVRNTLIPRYQAPPTTSERAFIKLNGSSLTTTANSQLVGVVVADANDDGGNTLIVASNGSTVVNNGNIAQAGRAPGIRLSGTGTTLTNSATGVIGIGYETIDRSGGTLNPTGLQDLGYTSKNIAIVATDNASVANAGIINVANRDIPGGAISAPGDLQVGKANVGIVVSGGATSSNTGTILIGGGDSNVANALGNYRGAAGMVAFNGGTATNAAGGTIRIGTSFAENVTDLANLTDVQSINYASGMTSLSGGGAIVNDGTIRIGSRAQNANGMLVGGVGNTALNTGTIAIDASTATAPTQRNAAISVLGSSATGAVNATNGATGVIRIGGVNGVGLLVENEVSGGSARVVNDGTIVIDGGLSVDRLRNYGVYVGNASSSAQQNGAVVLRGEGAIGVHARNGGTVDVTSGGTVDFQGARQIGYYALGTGSTINIASATTVDTEGSTGLRVEGGAVARGGNLAFAVSGANAVGIVGTGVSTGTTVDTSGMSLVVSGAGATGVVIEGGATGAIGSGAIQLAGASTTAAIVDGQGHALDGSKRRHPAGGHAASRQCGVGLVLHRRDRLCRAQPGEPGEQRRDHLHRARRHGHRRDDGGERNEQRRHHAGRRQRLRHRSVRHRHERHSHRQHRRQRHRRADRQWRKLRQQRRDRAGVRHRHPRRWHRLHAGRHGHRARLRRRRRGGTAAGERRLGQFGRQLLGVAAPRTACWSTPARAH